MRYSHYSAKPERYDPQFIGIARRYSLQKHQRQQSESQRNHLHSAYQHERHLNRHLRKTIQAKSTELKKLKSAKQRHERQLQLKKEQQEKYQQKLQQLVEMNKITRQQSKMKRKEAKAAVFMRNHLRKRELEEEMNAIHTFYYTLADNRRNHMKSQHFAAKEHQTVAKLHIDQYYRQKNKQSLKDYYLKIQQEMNSQRDLQQTNQSYQEKLTKINKKIQLKKHILENLQKQIANIAPKPKSAAKFRREKLFSSSSANSDLFSEAIPTQ